MRKIDNCTGEYSLSKTLRFRAIPIGETAENIQKMDIIKNDENRSAVFKEVKKLMDRYHKVFIDRCLSEVDLNGLQDYEKMYLKQAKDDKDKKELTTIETSLREQIVEKFRGDKDFEKLTKKEMLSELVPSILTDPNELAMVESFNGFSTAFTGFNTNRSNMYSSDEKASSIAYRSINENLPRFIVNRVNFEKIKQALPESNLSKINTEFNSNSFEVQDCFDLEFFNQVLTQQGIDCYNSFLGGYTTEEGIKIQGLNEYINLYNQKLGKAEKAKRLPKLQPLYKQILGDGIGISYYSDGLKEDQEVYDAINLFWSELENANVLDGIKGLFSNLSEYKPEGIYVKNDASVQSLSKAVTGDWSTIVSKWNEEYDAKNMKKTPKDYEKYDEKRRKAWKSVDSFTIAELDALMKGESKKGESKKGESKKGEPVFEYYTQMVKEQYNQIMSSYDVIKKELVVDATDKPLKKDDDKIAKIKALLDSLKGLELLLKPIQGTGKETNRDEVFYGEFVPLYDKLRSVDLVYDQVRNYVTQKPYSNEKFKLYFDNPQFMGGWDRNKEADYSAALLRKAGNYYIVVIPENAKDIIQELDVSVPKEEEYYEKMVYKLIPNPSKYLSSKQIIPQNPPEDIVRILKKKKEKKEALTRDELNNFINYLKDDFLKNYPKIIDDSGKSYFNFDFKETEEYEKLNDFFADVEKQAYSVRFNKISSVLVDEYVKKGKIFLFKLYNKDFSEKSHGLKNLHTLYFLNLFSETNLKEPKMRLNGGAEMFYRKASIRKEDLIIHKANKPIKTKNPKSEKEAVTFSYDIVKDRRYSEDQFYFHVPITINSNLALTDPLNYKVRSMLKEEENPYVIGIDRGERNLIYICVIDGHGQIVEQVSLNEIVNECNGTEYRTDYHNLLDKKEKERKEARQNWTTIENIKELKEGYISQVVHKICQLVMKYDAVIALEDLNSGFKNSRVKVEKQVYQKFEKMIIDKLNYMVDKTKNPDDGGGIRCGYQLTNKFESFKRMSTQNGFLFYIPAWLTSKIDPVTGFVNLLKPKYKNMDESKSFLRLFDSISYVEEEKMFKFSVDYSKFERTDADYRKKWELYTYGERIRTFRNPEKNNEWDNINVELTKEFSILFKKYNVNISSDNMIDDICSISDASFYKELLGLIGLMLQMRNSITGTDTDYLISPVKDKTGRFYDSRIYENKSDAKLPKDADANGAYNIARKVLWAIQVFKGTEDEELPKAKIAISNKQWLEFAQKPQCNE